MAEDRARYGFAALAGLIPGVLLPGQAAATEVRWVHAVPGGGQGQLDVTGRSARTLLAQASFGQVTSYRRVPPGRHKLVLAVGGKNVATKPALLARDARYTIVALAPASGAELKVLRDGAAHAGQARLRVVHAAPELGMPDLRLDGKVVAHGFRFGTASPYLTVRPGRHTAAVVQPGSGEVVVRDGDAELRAGTTSTAFVLGTRGEALRIVLVRDATAPSRARKAKSAPPPQHRGRAVHVVQPGESLWSISARRLGPRATNRQIMLEVLRLWRLNGRHIPSGDPDVIYPGLRLRLV